MGIGSPRGMDFKIPAPRSGPKKSRARASKGDIASEKNGAGASKGDIASPREIISPFRSRVVRASKGESPLHFHLSARNRRRAIRER